MIEVALGAIATVAILALLIPLLRPASSPPRRRRHELAIYRDQLAQLGREIEGGLISPAEARAAETEIQRRMLAAAEGEPSDGAIDASPARRARWIAGMLVLGIVPIGAVAVYLAIGSPAEPAHPFDPSRAAAPAGDVPAEVRAMVDRLAERLTREPHDLEGWLMLARSYTVLDRPADAAAAYRNAYALAGEDAPFVGLYATALVEAADGLVTPEARALFDRAAALDPRDPRPRYYLGLAEAQAGHAREAIAHWRALEADSPSDAPWLPALREAIAGTARRSGLDPARIAPAPLPPAAPGAVRE